jgi:hypothetical protein
LSRENLKRRKTVTNLGMDQEQIREIERRLNRLEKLENLTRLDNFERMEARLAPYMGRRGPVTVNPPSGEWRLTSSVDLPRASTEQC